MIKSMTQLILGIKFISPIACATKTSFEKKMELGKIPSNCPFLQPKRTNIEIWSIISSSSRRGIRYIEIITAASAYLILQAASDMSYLVAALYSSGGKTDIMPPLTKMKDAISLADKANQELNQFRRNMIKPYLPPQFIKLADISDDSTNFLFGDSIADTVESLRKANQIKLLKDNTLKVNRRRQTIKPLQSPRTGIQTTGKNKGLSNQATAKNPQKTTPSVLPEVNTPTHQYATGRTASTTKGNINPL